jgi:hypothetical protein
VWKVLSESGVHFSSNLWLKKGWSVRMLPVKRLKHIIQFLNFIESSTLIEDGCLCVPLKQHLTKRFKNLYLSNLTVDKSLMLWKTPVFQVVYFSQRCWVKHNFLWTVWIQCKMQLVHQIYMGQLVHEFWHKWNCNNTDKTSENTAWIKN